jgi:hypothetical protein
VAGLVPLPSKYIYNVLSKNPNAPYPGNRIEFFISLNGSDDAGVTGLTPDDAFRTGQHCVDHIYNTYYFGPQTPQVFCRYVGTGTTSPAAYSENVQPTGNLVGAQGIAGTPLFFWGTAPLQGPWDESVGAYYRDARDVVIDASQTPPFHCATNLTPTACGVFAGINGSVFGIYHLTLSSGATQAAIAAAGNGTIIQTGNLQFGTIGIAFQAVSGGQIINVGDESLLANENTFVNVTGNSQFYWVGGVLHFRDANVTNFVVTDTLGFASFGALSSDSQTGQVTHSCIINGNSVVQLAGATLPGPGSCAPTNGGQLLW